MSSVIGSVSVRVVPTFSGTHKAVSKQFVGLGNMAAASMAKPIQTSLREAVRGSITAGSTRAMQQVEAATRDIGKAEEQLTRARQAQGATHARVVLAEENLQKVRDSGKASAGDVLKAEADLDKARRTHRGSLVAIEEAQKSVTKAKDAATTATKAHESALKKEQTTLHKVGASFPVIGEQLKGLGTQFQKVGQQISSVGSTMTKNITLPAAGAAAAIGGIVVAGGFRRLVGIDTARAKLKALGHDATSVEAIMENALAAVKGTSFGLDEAATVAASAVAAGIKPGKELEAYLTSTGDAAAIAETSLAEMGSMFNKVSTSGRAYTGDLMMLGDRGIPIVQYLGEQLSLTSDEVYKMASAGKISSEMYLKAVQDNLGGAAAIMGAESFTAAWANVWAAVNRVGASFLDAGGKGGGFFSQMKPLMAEFTALVDVSGDTAAEWGVKFGELFTGLIRNIRGAVTWWNNLEGSQQKALISLAGLAVTAGPVLLVLGKIVTVMGSLITTTGTVAGWIGGLAKTASDAGGGMALMRAGLSKLGGGLKFIGGPIGWVATALAAVWSGSERFRESLGNLGSTIWGSLVGAFQAIWPMVKDLGSALGDLFSTLFSGGGESTGIMEKLGTVISWMITPLTWLAQMMIQLTSVMIQLAVGALTWLTRGLTWLADVVFSVVGVALDWVGEKLGVLGAWFATLRDQSTTQGGVIAGVWQWIKDAAAGVASWFTGTALPIFQQVWSGIVTGATWVWQMLQGAWSGIVAGATWLWGAIQTVFGYVKTAFDAVVTGISWAWTTILSPVFSAIGSVISWLWTNIASPIFGFIGTAFSVLGSVLGWVWNGVIAPVFTLLIDIIKFLWTNVAMPMFQRIGFAFSNMGTILTGIWLAFIKPVFDAVASIIGWLWNTIAKPIFGFIGLAFGVMATAVQFVWVSILKPVIDRLGAIMRWVWDSVISPVLGWIANKWMTTALWMRDKYNQYVKPVLDWFGAAIRVLYRDYIKPALGWISERWSWLVGRISGFWNDKLKPVFKAVGDFVKNDVVNMVKDGVSAIDKAWRKVANFFRKPINSVIDFVWNDGIKAMFDSVAKAVNSDARLGEISKIPAFAKGGAVRGPGSGTSDDVVAKLSNGEHVLTAAEVKAMGGHKGVYDWRKTLITGGDVEEGQHRLPLGGFGSWIKDTVASAFSWVRGGLANTAEKFIKPFTSGIADHATEFGPMGKLGGGLINWGVDEVLDWIRGKDTEVSAGGNYEGTFTANPGGFNRPSQGVITSWAGPRNLAGAYSNYHHGVDFAAAHNSPVRAAWGGVVKRASGGFGTLGNLIVLNHGGFDTAYAHLNGYAVKPGQTVKGGQIIGRQGNTGGSLGSHLHFERHPGGFYNPGEVNSLFRDKGGLLPQGISQVLNNTGGNEFIFNQQQFDNLNRLAESGGGGLAEQLHYHAHSAGSQYEDASDFQRFYRRAQRVGV